MRLAIDAAEIKVLQVLEQWRKDHGYFRFALNISDASGDDEFHGVVTYVHKIGGYMENYYVIADLESGEVILFKEMRIVK